LKRAKAKALTRGDFDPVFAGLLLFALPSLFLGLLMAMAPGAFFELIGPYGVRNDHYIHDTASFQIALASLLLIAVRQPSWRVPALAANAIQWSLHALSHTLDIGEAAPSWIGYFDLFATIGGALLLCALTVAAVRREQAGP
jgi:hypothetical protein